jgi:hypothetical protein
MTGIVATKAPVADGFCPREISEINAQPMEPENAQQLENKLDLK